MLARRARQSNNMEEPARRCDDPPLLELAVPSHLRMSVRAKNRFSISRRFRTCRNVIWTCRVILFGSILLTSRSMSSVEASDPAETQPKTGGGVNWAVIFANPQNIGILFGLIMAVLVIIYCLSKKIADCLYAMWNMFCRFPCCLTCKWCCVPCYKACRNSIAGCKDAFYEGPHRCCDHHFHPWKKMEYVTSVHNDDTCWCC